MAHALADLATALDELGRSWALVGGLIAMKLLSVNDARLQDALDLRALLAHASATDLEATRARAALITARGFNRGRDLEAQLTQYLPLD